MLRRKKNQVNLPFMLCLPFRSICRLRHTLFRRQCGNRAEVTLMMTTVQQCTMPRWAQILVSLPDRYSVGCRILTARERLRKWIHAWYQETNGDPLGGDHGRSRRQLSPDEAFYSFRRVDDPALHIRPRRSCAGANPRSAAVRNHYVVAGRGS